MCPHPVFVFLLNMLSNCMCFFSPMCLNVEQAEPAVTADQPGQRTGEGCSRILHHQKPDDPSVL